MTQPIFDSVFTGPNKEWQAQTQPASIDNLWTFYLIHKDTVSQHQICLNECPYAQNLPIAIESIVR